MTQKKSPDGDSLAAWLEKLETQHNKKIDLGLSRVKQVCQNLKLDDIAPTIISVAGTNGKGSTVAIISAICQQAGYKVGEFTSPHILRYNERIKINSNEVIDSEIVTSFEKIEEGLLGISLSYFEYATLAAAIIFKNNKVDVAILEVGLGGRLDSVNVIDSDCAIITTIDIDHTTFLGNTIEDIAFEKAGIMRTEKPAIYGDKNCPKAIIEHAKKIRAKLLFAEDFNKKKYTTPNLNGNYQRQNAATAIMALNSLNSKLKISTKDINMGLANIKLSGRLQQISKSPAVFVDVSHNRQAAQSLSTWLEENPVAGKTIAVFAVLEDKKALDWVDIFKNTIDVWCISAVDSSRSLATQELLNILANSARLIMSFKTVPQAFSKAKVIAQADDRIVVFGSFYTVSEVMSVCV